MIFKNPLQNYSEKYRFVVCERGVVAVHALPDTECQDFKELSNKREQIRKASSQCRGLNKQSELGSMFKCSNIGSYSVRINLIFVSKQLFPHPTPKATNWYHLWRAKGGKFCNCLLQNFQLSLPFKITKAFISSHHSHMVSEKSDGIHWLQLFKCYLFWPSPRFIQLNYILMSGQI